MTKLEALSDLLDNTDLVRRAAGVIRSIRIDEHGDGFIPHDEMSDVMALLEESRDASQ